MIFEKESDDKLIYWVDPEDNREDTILFSFDGKTVFNFWQDYPENLTSKQIQIFKQENPTLAALKPTRND